MASIPTLGEGGTTQSNGQGFNSTYIYVSGPVPGQTQAKTTAKQNPPVSTLPYVHVTTGFKPTTTELIVVGGLAAFAIVYFAMHHKGKQGG